MSLTFAQAALYAGALFVLFLTPGPVWLVALFSPAPLTLETVRAAAAGGDPGDRDTWAGLTDAVIIRRFEVPR